MQLGRRRILRWSSPGSNRIFPEKNLMAVTADKKSAHELIRPGFLDFPTFWTNNLHTPPRLPPRIQFSCQMDVCEAFLEMCLNNNKLTGTYRNARFPRTIAGVGEIPEPWVIYHRRDSGSQLMFFHTVPQRITRESQEARRLALIVTRLL